MDANGRKLICKDEVFRIVGTAMSVYNELGFGFLEAVYQEALAMEFIDCGIPFEAEKRINISYKNKLLKKEYFADFICFGQVIVEIKAIKQTTAIEEAQLLNYLKATSLPVGLLMNFGGTKLDWKRYVNTKGATKRH